MHVVVGCTGSGTVDNSIFVEVLDYFVAANSGSTNNTNPIDHHQNLLHLLYLHLNHLLHSYSQPRFRDP